ncbi:MAG: PaaI family thioesterase [Pseudomonadota bacterium]
MTFDEFIGVSYQDGDTATIDIQSHHCNPTGNINGGVLISIADNLSTGAAGRAYLEKTGEQKFLVGIDLHASMVANQLGGQITAQALPVKVGRRIVVVRTEVTGDNNRLLAVVTTTHVPN